MSNFFGKIQGLFDIQEGKPLILGTFFDIPYCERKKENGIRRKVFGLFAALYHLEEWLNCHWKSVKVIFRVGGHFLYLLMAEHNNFWVLGFHAFQINESVIY